MSSEKQTKMSRCIDSSKVSKKKHSVHALPCRIKHNGPLNSTQMHWVTEKSEDGSLTAHFRGRRLKGREVQIPDQFKGVILKTTDRILSEPRNVPQEDGESKEEMEEDEEDRMVQESLVMEEVAIFDTITVWGHDTVPSETEDPYFRGVDEWIKFASVMHSYDDHENSQPE